MGPRLYCGPSLSCLLLKPQLDCHSASLTPAHRFIIQQDDIKEEERKKENEDVWKERERRKKEQTNLF